MTLIQLLDKIDETAPRTCQTCIHMATHAKCDGCLGRGEVFEYKNWEPGNWLREVHRMEVSGARNIVIGGQGEAEVNTRWTPQYASEELHRVACCCGYMVNGLKHRDELTTLSIWTSEGEFRIDWEAGTLMRIGRIQGRQWAWDRENPEPL